MIFASWNRLSYVVISTLAATCLAYLWIEHVRVPYQHRNLSFDLGDLFIMTMSVGAAAGFLARGIALAMRWRASAVQSLLTGLFNLVSVPAFLGAQMAYEQWQRRPPTADCASRDFFRVELGNHTLSTPNWPLVMVRSGDESFSTSIPSHLRRICQWSAPGSYGVADSVTFFFDHIVSRTKPELKAWTERECRAADGVAAELVCGERPIEQLSIYADREFKHRTISYGRASSHAFFKQREKEGHFPASEARRHPSASAYPDGTWVFDDGSVFSCRQSASGPLRCRGDFEPAPGLLAKVEFNARNGDIEAGQRSAKEAFQRLYKEVLSGKPR